MILDENYILPNGVSVPKLGLGTWLIPDSEVASAVRSAIAAGYRHIDTAQAYENERGTGEGVRSSGVPRENIFITTKVAAEIKDYDGAAASIDESLRKLDCGPIDLVIIHCPQPWAEFRGEKRYFKENKEVWKALEDAYQEGKVRAIGVSNFLEDDLLNILDGGRIKPMVNQFKIHIGLTPSSLIDFCKQQEIVPEAYSPIAHGSALHDPFIAGMAQKYGVSVPQLCIRYTLQLGAISLPKSTKDEHIRANTKLEFSISDEDMEVLRGFSLD